MQKSFLYILGICCVFLTGCSTPSATISDTTIGNTKVGVDSIPSPETIADNWKMLNSDRTDLNIYLPKEIPAELSPYSINRTYAYQKENAVLFALPDDIVGYNKATNAYIFEFINREKDTASLNISVLSGEVEVRILSLDMDTGQQSDYISLGAGEQKQISLSDYYYTSPEEDDIQLLVMRALSPYVIFNYEISL